MRRRRRRQRRRSRTIDSPLIGAETLPGRPTAARWSVRNSSIARGSSDGDRSSNRPGASVSDRRSKATAGHRPIGRRPATDASVASTGGMVIDWAHSSGRLDAVGSEYVVSTVGYGEYTRRVSLPDTLYRRERTTSIRQGVPPREARVAVDRGGISIELIRLRVEITDIGTNTA